MSRYSELQIPEHVPEHLVVDFDYFRFAEQEPDIHRAWARLHDGPAIFWSPHHGGHWVVTRAEDLKEIYSDHQRFTSNQQSIPRAQPFLFPPVEIDPPLHASYRSLIFPAFSPRSIHALRGHVRELTVELIDSLRTQGQCEFYGDFALHMPIGIFLSIVKLPASDRARMLGWADAATRASDPDEITAAFAQAWAYLDEKFRERRANPGSDLISVLCNARIDGRPLSHEELLGFGSVILFGGLDTVASSLGFIVRHMAENPAERDRLANDPGLIPLAVDELFRRFAITNMARGVKEDMEYRNVQFRKGDPILLPTALYNLDKRVYPNPFEIDYGRRNSSEQLGFGWGAHRCIGVSLARTELEVFLQEWLGRIPQFRIADGAAVEVRTGKVNAVTRLPLAWDVSTTTDRGLAG